MDRSLNIHLAHQVLSEIIDVVTKRKIYSLSDEKQVDYGQKTALLTPSVFT